VSHIGKYEVVTQVGAFKHARVKVFRAFDRDIGRPITLKLVADASDPWLADEFRHEVSSVAKLRVPNVIAIRRDAGSGRRSCGAGNRRPKVA
jgi:hypothetical protein